MKLKTVAAQLNEGHELFRIHTHSDGGDRGVQVFSSSDKLTVRINSVPTEIFVKTKAGHYSSFRDLLLKELEGFEPPAARAKEYHNETLDLVYSENKSTSELNEKFESDVAKLIDHFTTIIKSKILELIHDTEEHEVERAKQAATMLKGKYK